MAREYLPGAKGAADIVGRARIALLALARWADEDAVQSQRSFYELRFSAYVFRDHGMACRGKPA